MSKVPYDQHFGLRINPFDAEDDPASLYMSIHHKEALAHLFYGLSTDGGFVLLTGDIGTGKTSLLRCFLAELPAHADAACVEHPCSEAHALLRQVCSAFGIPTDPAAPLQHHIDLLNVHQMMNQTNGRRSILIVDDAQLLTPDLLEQLRLLTNLESRGFQALQIVLVGQTGLRDLLDRPELRQISQRVVGRYHLRPLPRRELLAYVHHRLRAAGGRPETVSRWLSWPLHRLTGGVPRGINQLCDRALHRAAGMRKPAMDRTSIREAARDLSMQHVAAPPSGMARLAGVSTVLLVAFGVIVMATGQRGRGSTAITAAHARAAAPLKQPASASLPAVLPSVESAAVKPDLRKGGSPADSPGWLALAVRATPEGVAASAPAASAWPQTAARPFDTAAASAGATAFSDLLKRWGASSTTWRGCHAVPAAQLQCLQGKGGLAELRDLNLPAVLHLVDPHGRRTEALLQSISASTVSLRLDGADHQIPLAELATRWQGDYTLLWRTPPAFNHPLRIGQAGPGVAWLRARLSLPKAQTLPSNDTGRFDLRLQARLREFQLREHLEPDGIAGIKSLVRLTHRTDPAQPSLNPTSVPR
jgi:general secretion pathway protein A